MTEEQEEHDQWWAEALNEATTSAMRAFETIEREDQTGKWCGERISELWLIASAMPSLTEDHNEQHVRNLLKLRALARCYYEAHDHVDVDDLVRARFVVDCFEGVGPMGVASLAALKVVLSAALIYEIRKPVKVSAIAPSPDLTALVALAWMELTDEGTQRDDSDDYLVKVDQRFVDMAHGERVSNFVEQMGGPEMSEN